MKSSYKPQETAEPKVILKAVSSISQQKQNSLMGYQVLCTDGSGCSTAVEPTPPNPEVVIFNHMICGQLYQKFIPSCAAWADKSSVSSDWAFKTCSVLPVLL